MQFSRDFFLPTAGDSPVRKFAWSLNNLLEIGAARRVSEQALVRR